MSPEWPPPYQPDKDRPPRQPGQWPPPYKRQPLGVFASVVAAVFAVAGLFVVAYMIFVAIALASWGNTK